jgi:hypothetical protein
MSGYYYVSNYRIQGRLYSHTHWFDGDNATQAAREHTASLTFLWVKPEMSGAYVSSLYGLQGNTVRHGGRHGQARPDKYVEVPMPQDIAEQILGLS